MKDLEDLFYKLSTDETIERLSTNISDGLNKKEVIERQTKFGLNILPSSKKKSIIELFFQGLKDPIVIVLIVASLLSFLAKEYIDGFAVLFIILLDLILGTFEEYKANKSAEAMQKLIKIKSKVIRNGKVEIIDSDDIVVGDVVLFEAGDKIPADARIIESKNLTADESILTGESIPCEKNEEILNKKLSIHERKNMLYSATAIVTGRAKAVITAIGINTEIGKIANEVNNTEEEKSPLTIRTEKFSKQISVIIVIISIFIAIILGYKGFEGTEIFLSVVALSVSAMPEGLPLALTMALTIASNKMLKKNVIVKKLNAVESLGSCTIIASDKTGTLTVNEQTAKKIVLPNDSLFEITGSGYNDKGEIIADENSSLKDIELLIESTTINNEATLEKKGNKFKRMGDSIDIAFLALGKKYGIDVSMIEKKDIIPYESENKYSAVFYEKDSFVYCTAKGSVEVILDFCSNMIVNNKKTKLDKELILKQNEKLAKAGYRVIAVASSKVSNNYKPDVIDKLNFLGLVAFIDPIRTTAIESINKCKEAGIKTVMITGDHPLTAFSIAKELKIADYLNDVATGDDVEKYFKKTEVEFDNFVKNKTVFSRVTPIQKLRIVESYKRQGEFIAVTGDGVNDAPALKAANIGIAMGSGTDVAKETASMIIVNDDFSSIVEGIEEGRTAYSNIRKISYLLLSCGITEVLFFLLSIVFNMPIPLVAIQLLWINIVTDGLQDLALSFEKSEKGIMKEKPRSPKESLFDKALIIEILISGIFMGVIVFIMWHYLINKIGLDVSIARGYILALMVFIQNIHVLNCRSEKLSAFKISLKSNPFILFSIIGSIALQIIFMEVPILSEFLQTSSIKPITLLSLFILAIPVLFVMETYKLFLTKGDE